MSGTAIRATMKSAALLFALCAGLASAQQQRPGQPYGPMSDAGAANLPGQAIGRNDLLAISVYDAPEFTRTVRVSSEGHIRLPMVQQAIRAVGLLPSQLEEAIAGVLSKEGILVRPVVMVTVAEYSSRPVSVVGAVRKPVTFQAIGRVTLLDAIARAEGLGELAGPELLLTQEDGSGAGRLTRRILVRDLMDASKAELNIELNGGEEIRVPEARKIFVAGNVKKPGAIAVREDGQMTVMKALALSEGLTPYPQNHAYIYRKDEAAGGVREIQVELKKILRREAVDIALEPEDTLYVPEASGKKTAFTLTEKIVGFGLATASGVLIWRR
jgi:polysaccharide export outer membrane protein